MSFARCFLIAGMAAAGSVSWCKSGGQDLSSLHHLLVVPDMRREARAAWVATVSNIDWPTSKSLTPTQQRAEIINILNVAQDLNLNMLFLQVRPQCDALYSSTKEPWSEYLTGLMGRAPNPLYDPLQYWITEAHNRGIQIHAWFNPYRALTNANATAVQPHPAVNPLMSGAVVTYGTAKYLNPGDPRTPTWTRDVILDVVTRYDIDGVVFDDYFYPYPIANTAFPDSSQYAQYGGGLTLANWRRKNVDDFVQSTGSAIKAIKPWVQYGIGPFGIWQPGNPSGIVGLNAYESLYADSKKWLNLGWVDYLSPQLYWQIGDSGQEYEKLLPWWVSQNWAMRHVWPSNFTSKLDGTSTGWPASAILDQVNLTRATPGATGNVHFSMRAFTQNRLNIRTLLKADQYSAPALVPASPWIDNTAPLSPTVTYQMNRSTGQHIINWSFNGSEPARQTVVAQLIGDTWKYQTFASFTTSLAVPVKNSGKALRAFAVATVDRLGNQSPWVPRVLDSSAVSSPVRDR